MTQKSILYIFSGLPGSGKTTIAKGIASALNSVYLRIDTVEQALWELCNFKAEEEGYRLSYRIASDNLRLGMSVIADSCNPIILTRREWEEVALSAHAQFLNIEVLCSNADEHRQRVETRQPDGTGPLPTWEQVVHREYHTWESARLIIDTAGKSQQESITETLSQIREWGKNN